MHNPAVAMQTAVTAIVEQIANDNALDRPWPPIDWSLAQIRSAAAPAFPLDVLGPAWGEWVAAAAEGAGCPPDYVALPLLGLAGAILANVRRGAPWPGWEEASALWLACVGDPSSGKSSGGSIVATLAKELEHAINLDLDERKRRHAAAVEAAELVEERWKREVQEAVKRGVPPPEKPKDACAPAEPVMRRIVTSEPTSQAFVKLAQANPRGVLVFRDELAGWVGSMDQFSGAGNDRAMWLESWRGGSFAQDRLKDGDEPRVVPHLSASVVGTIQPDRLASTMLAGDDDGLAARFIYAWPDALPPKIPDRAADLATAQRWLTRLLKLYDGDVKEDVLEPRAVPFDDEARQVLQRFRLWVAAHEPNMSGRLESWTGKTPGFVVRLATVLRFLRWTVEAPDAEEPGDVRGVDVDAAVRFVQLYAGPMAARAFGEAGAPERDRDAAALARWLRTAAPQLGGVVNASKLRRWKVLGASADAERYEAALAELEEGGWVRRAPRTCGTGRPPKDWLLNPALAAAPAA